MNCFEINKKWRTENGGVDLPFDLLPDRKRDYNIPDGAENSYYPPVYFALTRTLPIKKCHKNILEIDGVCGTADVYEDDVLKTVITRKTKSFLDLGGAARSVQLKLGIAASNEGKYTGAGIAHGVKLFTAENPIYVKPYGLHAVTDKIEDKAYLTVTAEIVNETAYTQQLVAEAVILNARGKRVGKRQRKLKLGPGAARTVTIPVRVSRYYPWSLSDPYLYTCELTVSDAKVLDTARVQFGIRTLNYTPKGFELNGKVIKLKGGTVYPDNGVLGAASYPSAEIRKCAAMKEAGYNAVRVTNPSDALLDALDKTGLLAIVDLLEVWRQPKHPLDRHRYFEKDAFASAETSVRALMCRACVAAYSLGDGLPESYGRGEGAVWAEKLIAAVKAVDSSRPVLCELRELDPTDAEILAAGGKLQYPKEVLTSFVREKDLFKKNTEAFASKFDLVGYDDLFYRYSIDKLVLNRNIIGTSSRPKRAFESFDESEKNGIAGEFASAAFDYLGAPKTETGLLPERSTSHGDMDITGVRKPLSYYREIVFGVKPRSYITVTPEDEMKEYGEWDAPGGEHLWNWPRHVGKPVIVEVYTSGEVVALYLDGKLLGRKLAGRINRHIATFKTNYYPGKLEAISFHRGLEHSRCTLETVSSPKQIKLTAQDKQCVLDSDGLCFIDIAVCDAAGLPVPFAQREVTVKVTGEGELFAVGSGDPRSVVPARSETVSVYNGRAIAVVKGIAEGKISVKATSDGLLCGKLTVKVK